MGCAPGERPQVPFQHLAWSTEPLLDGALLTAAPKPQSCTSVMSISYDISALLSMKPGSLYRSTPLDEVCWGEEGRTSPPAKLDIHPKLRSRSC